MLSGLPSTKPDPLREFSMPQSVSSLVLCPRNYVTEQMKKVHWLPTRYRINFKLCLMMHAAVTSGCPQYIRDIVLPLSTLPGRIRFRAAAHCQFDIPRTRTVFGERAFTVAGSRKWNSLPQDITDITNREAFKRALKTFFYVSL